MSNFFKKLENGVPVGNLIIRKNLKDIIPNVDLNNPNDLLSAGYCIHNNTTKPVFIIGNYTKEYVNAGDIAIEGQVNTYDFNWILQEKSLTEVELNDLKKRAWADLRDTRKVLLKLTDVFALSDVNISDEMKAYRKALRDLPANTEDPFNVSWPICPITLEKLKEKN